eukprot:165410-Rhodomonas_salina.1
MQFLLLDFAVYGAEMRWHCRDSNTERLSPDANVAQVALGMWSFVCNASLVVRCRHAGVGKARLPKARSAKAAPCYTAEPQASQKKPHSCFMLSLCTQSAVSCTWFRGAVGGNLEVGDLEPRTRYHAAQVTQTGRVQ